MSSQPAQPSRPTQPTTQPTIITTPALDAEKVSAFSASLRGSVLHIGDPGYDEARRIQNGLIDRHPAMIVRCSGTADVVAAVNFAREHRLTLSIRGGGHNVAGNAMNDGGLVIDLSMMRSVHVDHGTHTVRADGGCTWGDVDRESQLFGLAVPGGVVSTTGIGGLTLHGGLGHLRRKYGLSLDNILEVEIVTADGQVRIANASENPDLFWAVRGAGSNFGVVTSFLFRAHPVGPTLFLSATAYALEDGRAVLKAWREFTMTTPEEISTLAIPWSLPDVDAFPPEVRTKPVIILAAVYAGDVAEGERLTKPLREAATPLLDLSHMAAYTEIQSSFDPFFPKGQLSYWKSLYLDEMSDEAIDTIVRYAETRPSALTDMGTWHLGGAISRVSPDATAYRRRDAPYLFTAESTWLDPADTDSNIQWARDAIAAMQPFSKGGLYLNFPGFGEEREAMLRATYGPNYDRLVALKEQYDPTNLFNMNQNIKPGTAATSA